MASAHRYSWQRTDGSTGRAWRAKWTGHDGRPKSKRGFDRKGDAEEYARARELEARTGVQLPDAPTDATTLDAWAKAWLAGLEVRPQTEASYRYALDRVLPTYGRRALASLRPSELKALRRGLAARYAPATAEQTMAILGMVLRAAVNDGLLPRSPLPPSTGGTGGRVVDPDELLSLEQVRGWGAAMPEVAREMPVVAAATGLRQGELLGLRLPAVDFLRRQIRVSEQLVSPLGAGVPTWGPPKTAAGERTVPLPRVAAEALARHLERFPAVDGEPLFRTTCGHRWRRTTFGEVWRAAASCSEHTAATKAGVPAKTCTDPKRPCAGLPPWAHWHALRDVAASALIRQGNDVRVVMSILGHTSSEETLRTYGRLWPDAQDRARQSLDDLWDDGPDGESARG